MLGEPLGLDRKGHDSKASLPGRPRGPAAGPSMAILLGGLEDTLQGRHGPGRSSPAAQRSNVLLPEPDGPITAVKLARGNAIETSRRAATAFPPLPYTRVTD